MTQRNNEPWPTHELEMLRSMHEQKKTMGQISKALGTRSRSAVSGMASRMGLVRTAPPRPDRPEWDDLGRQGVRIAWTDEKVAFLERRWDEGASLAEIAVEIGRSPDSVRSKVRAMGLDERKRGRKPVNPETTWSDPEKVAVLVRMWKAGHSAGEVAKVLGVTRLSVCGRVSRMGLPREHRGQPSAPSLRAPTVKSAPVRTAPRPGPQKATPVAFGYMPATTHAEAQKKREEALNFGERVIRDFASPANDDAIPLIRREFGQCSWPVGDPIRPAEQLCCGRPIIGDRTKSTATYCEIHRKLAAPLGVPSVRDLARSIRRAA